jgi:hypothetical protein
LSYKQKQQNSTRPFSTCEISKERGIPPEKIAFSGSYLSTITVDKFFLFDSQKDMEKRQKMARCRDVFLNIST